jgi:cobalt/nickel transport system permease protein
MAVLVLISVTPFQEIVNSMRWLRMPHIFVIVFEMTYRYIGVLFEEAYSMYVAYSLRSADAKGIAMRDMGSFAGQLLIRSFARADRVYNAMKCRGYALHSLPRGGGKPAKGDFVFLAVTCVLCVACRLVNVNALFTNILGRLF